jgi:hypothetical protein
MRINARLDEERSRKLDYLMHVTGSGVSEILRRAIDVYYHRVRERDDKSAALLTKSGLIGCAEGPEDLSENYKEELLDELKEKHDHR